MAVLRDEDHDEFVLRVEDLEDIELRILRLEGREEISRLYRFELELVSEEPAIDFASIVGKAVAITIAGQYGPGEAGGEGGEPVDSYLHGIASRFEQGPTSRGPGSSAGGRFTHYFMELVPRFWTLKNRIDTRIFQDKKVPEIIQAVFDGAGIEASRHRSSLKATYQPREYCVQYQESDWDFVSRLMEEEGIFFFFEQNDKDHVLVLGDDSSAHAAIGGKQEVPFHDPTLGNPDEEYVGRFRYAEQVRIGKYSMTDYNFTRPSTPLDALQQSDTTTELEAFEFPGRYAATEEGKRRASVRLEEQQALGKLGSGDSVVRRFSTGYRFKLADYPREDFNGEYLLTEVRHHVYQPGALEEEMPEDQTESGYTNTFRCIPSDVSYRPLRVTPRPYIRGTQSAIVTGPSGEEIYTDEYGRVKVHFFWDRHGKDDQNSSCWMRVSQSWAGSGWGATYIPRIGQEVLVSFLEGDPDRPYVVGSLYNASQMPPYKLPDEKTKSTLKSATSPDPSAGFNEIRFEDKAGEEQIFIHAQKNMDLRVKESRFELIEKKDHRIVREDAYSHVENDQHVKVDNDSFHEVGKDHHLKVAGKQALEVVDSYSLKVDGDVTEQFGANHSEEVSSSYYLSAMGVVIEASGTGITLKCGSNAVVIDQTGVTIKGTMITVDGSLVKIASGPGSSAASGSAGTLVSPTAPEDAEEADDADPGKVAEVKAQQMTTGTGKYGAAKTVPFKQKDAEQEETSWIELELVDEEGNPVPGEPYEVTLPDGKTVAKGTTDSKGRAKVQGIDPGTCQITFPKLDKDAWEPAG